MSRRALLSTWALVLVNLPSACSWSTSLGGSPPAVSIEQAGSGLGRLRGKADASSLFAEREMKSQQRAPSWDRAVFALLAGVVALVVWPRSAQAAGDVEMYFGQGCFWHVQHEFVRQEVNLLGRRSSEITALAGYAGGTETGAKGEVCYHNRDGAPDYATMGHAEVVHVSIPEQKVGEFSKSFFDGIGSTLLGRNDGVLSWGGEYRSVLGLPGGVESPLFAQVKEARSASLERLKLVAGRGSDPDTLLGSKVYIYDSDKYSFFQAEIYHQFHDDMLQQYDDSYHSLKTQLKQTGKLKDVSCPDETALKHVGPK